MTKYYDLSQPVKNTMSYYPGDPKPEIRPAAGVASPWRVSELSLGSHTGTHIDAAFHYFDGGMTIDQYPLERFILTGIVVFVGNLEPEEPIGFDRLEEGLMHSQKGGAFIIRTDWDRFWGQELYNHHPFLTPAAAKSLAEAGTGLVGIDALNVDSTSQATSSVHETLLGKNILIVENLSNLNRLNTRAIYQFSFLPLYLAGVDGSPVRAVAWEIEEKK